MEVIINNLSMQPIYEQIVEQIKEMILNQSLKPEMPLPSVRSLSGDLKISALTVKKAYDLLEGEGFIITVHGKGSYVAQANTQLILEKHRRQVEVQLEAAIRMGRNCGMQDAEIKELFQLIMEE